MGWCWRVCPERSHIAIVGFDRLENGFDARSRLDEALGSERNIDANLAGLGVCAPRDNSSVLVAAADKTAVERAVPFALAASAVAGKIRSDVPMSHDEVVRPHDASMVVIAIPVGAPDAPAHVSGDRDQHDPEEKTTIQPRAHVQLRVRVQSLLAEQTARGKLASNAVKCLFALHQLLPPQEDVNEV